MFKFIDRRELTKMIVGLRKIFIFLLCLLCFICVIFSDSCKLSQVSYGFRIKTGIFHTYIDGLQLCARNCMLRTDCHSINFNRFNGTCELSTNTAASKPEEVDVSQEWMQSDIANWPLTLAGACYSVACPPSHSCVYKRSRETTCVITECPSPPPNDIYSITSPKPYERNVGSSLDFVCQLGYVLVGAPKITCQANGSWSNALCRELNCPANWNRWKASCYYHAAGFKYPFSNAKAYCEKAVSRGYLAEIGDEAENTYVASINGHYKSFIGGNLIDGKWKWTHSMTLFNYTNWNQGEPSGGQETCVMYWTYEGKWNDCTCSVSEHFICEVAGW